MSVSPQDLATRALKKCAVIGATETPDDADLEEAVGKVRAAHMALDAGQYTRWTLRDIPPQVEEAYVGMTAFLLAPSFPAVKADPGWWTGGFSQILAFIQVRWQPSDVVRAEQL